MAKFYPKRVRFRRLLVGALLFLQWWDEEGELPSWLHEVVLLLHYWSYDQFFVNLGQLPADPDHMVAAKYFLQVVQGLDEPVRSLEKHSQMTKSSGLSKPPKSGF